MTTTRPWERPARRSIFHPGKEWDAWTRSWVARGWVEERRALTEAAMGEHRRGENVSGVCLDCGLDFRLHPPDRVWRSGPDLCAIALHHTECFE